MASKFTPTVDEAIAAAENPRARGGPAPWPVLQPVVDPARLARQGKSAKWQRQVVRFPADVKVLLQDGSLILEGRAGRMSLDLKRLDPTGLCGFRLASLEAPQPQPGGSTPSASEAPAAAQSALLLLVSPHPEAAGEVTTKVLEAARGVSQGYLVGMTVQGVGYRLEPVDDPSLLEGHKSWFFERVAYDKSNIVYPHPQAVRAVRLKVGYSRTIVFPLPHGVVAFCVKPTLLYLYGLDQQQLHKVAQQVRALRKPNVYTGNGITLLGEVPRSKQRKASGK